MRKKVGKLEIIPIFSYVVIEDTQFLIKLIKENYNGSELDAVAAAQLFVSYFSDCVRGGLNSFQKMSEEDINSVVNWIMDNTIDAVFSEFKDDEESIGIIYKNIERYHEYTWDDVQEMMIHLRPEYFYLSQLIDKLCFPDDSHDSESYLEIKATILEAFRRLGRDITHSLHKEYKVI